MGLHGWLQALLFLAVLTALAVPLGAYLERVFTGQPVLLARVLGRPERALLALLGDETQSWKAYARSALVFSAACFVALYATLRLQPGPGPPDLSFNTAISFVSNTSWQFYAGETTLSTTSQRWGLAVHSFLSAGVGLAVVAAVIRGFALRGEDRGLGSFWADLVRGLLYVIVPICAVAAVLLAAGGTPQSGDLPVASQMTIKALGSVGGGFFNVNSAMPFENPTAWTSLIQALLIIVVPAALTVTFGRMVGDRRQGWALFAGMAVLFVVSLAVIGAGEGAATPAMQAAGLEGPNLEGKETRFGADSTALYAVTTTAGSSGAVNGAMASFSGVGQTGVLANMMTGEVIFGGIGSGLYGMLMLVLLTAFLAAQMIGRTPSYVGKRIGPGTLRRALVGIVGVELVVLLCVALGVATAYGRVSILSAGPQGFTENLYAYVSQAFNNGSAMAAFTGYVQPVGTNEGAFGITFAQLLGGAAMLAGRYLPLVVALAVAGAMARERVSVPTVGTLRTDTAEFVVLLLAVVVVVALLTFVPALLLGPLTQALSGTLF